MGDGETQASVRPGAVLAGELGVVRAPDERNEEVLQDGLREPRTRVPHFHDQALGGRVPVHRHPGQAGQELGLVHTAHPAGAPGGLLGEGGHHAAPLGAGWRCSARTLKKAEEAVSKAPRSRSPLGLMGRTERMARRSAWSPE